MIRRSDIAQVGTQGAVEGIAPQRTEWRRQQSMATLPIMATTRKGGGCEAMRLT